MAPFKFHFSKMSKSRSKESRSSSTDCEESACPVQNSSSSRPETPAANAVSVHAGGATEFRNSPPPSYEYVLEETRMKQTNEKTVEEDEEEETQESSLSEGTSIRNRASPVGPEILHKSSKELYRAVAKQWGLTCKMNDHCRCFDCQSHYFDCEFDSKDEHDKGDGGLGAGTPMFIAEVIHGTACVLL